MPRTRPKPEKPMNATPAAPVAPGEVLTLTEAAAYLRLPEATVVQLVSGEGLPGRRAGDDWRFLKTAIQDWLRTPSPSVSKAAFWETHFGALKDDPYLEEMLKEIYKRRGRPETEAE